MPLFFLRQKTAMADLFPSKCRVAFWDWGVHFVSEALWELESQTPRVLLYVFRQRANTYALSSIASLPPPFSPFTHWKQRWDHSLRSVVGPVHSLCVFRGVCVRVCLSTLVSAFAFNISFVLLYFVTHLLYLLNVLTSCPTYSVNIIVPNCPSIEFYRCSEIASYVAFETT